MSPFTVTIATLRCAADQQKIAAFHEAAHLNIDQVERALWAVKQKPGAAFSLSVARQAAGVEFGLWCLKFAAEPKPGVADRSGRMTAMGYAWKALTWLDGAARTDYDFTHQHIEDLMRAVMSGEPLEEMWIGWVELLDQLMSAALRGDWADQALFAVGWCGQCMVVPTPFKKLPTQRGLDRLGRHCAHAAYDNLAHAWVTMQIRAAHEIADIATHGGQDPWPAIEDRLTTYSDTLRDQADAVLKPFVDAEWDRFMEVPR